MVVQGVNSWGHLCEIQTLQCELVSEITGATVPISDISLKEPRHRFEVNYIPNIKGQHQLSIKIDNQHIKGSPSTVRVKSVNVYGPHLVFANLAG